MRLITGVLLFLIPLSIFAQNDSIWMKSNDILVGELKSLSKSVVTFETDYSDKDFKIDYDGNIYLISDNPKSYLWKLSKIL